MFISPTGRRRQITTQISRFCILCYSCLNNLSSFRSMALSSLVKITPRVAIEYCKAYATQHGIHHSKATVVFASTLDILKDVHWEPGMILVLDEFHPYDTSQLIYVSETIMKQIVCPSEVTNIRARNFDIQIPKHIPRILTGNVPEEVQGLEHSMIQRWYGALVPFSVPLSAVEQTEHSSLP